MTFHFSFTPRALEDIYSDTREQIEASLPQEENPASRQSSLSSFSTTTATGSESASLSVPSSNGNATTLWEYKWNAEDTNVYGPFDTATMLAWLSQEHISFLCYDSVVLQKG